MKYFFYCILCLIFTLPLYSYDFKQDAFYFNLLEDGNVEITSGEEKYSGDLTIPSTTIYKGHTYKVIGIGDYAFAECRQLHDVVISEGIESIGTIAFGWCNSMGSLTLPSSLKKIGSEAFHACTNNTIYITDLESFCNLQCDASPCFRNVGENASLYLNGNLLTSLTLPESITTISSAFSGCNSIEEVFLGENVSRIDAGAFSNCERLQRVKMSPSLEYIGYDAFYRCYELTEIEIPASVNELGGEAFSYCTNLKHVQWKGSVDNIPYMCFYGSGLDTIELPEGVKTLEAFAFANCPNLKQIKLPSTITNIGDRCFNEDPNLIGVYLSSTIPPSIDMWPNQYALTLYVPTGSLHNYYLTCKTCTLKSYDAGFDVHEIYWTENVSIYDMDSHSCGESSLYYLAQNDKIKFSVPIKNNEVAKVYATSGTLTKLDDSENTWYYECDGQDATINIDIQLKRHAFTLLYPSMSTFTMMLPEGLDYSTTITSLDGWKVNNIQLNGETISGSFEGTHDIIIPEVLSDVVVSVALEKKNNNTGVVDANETIHDTKVFSLSGKIVVNSNNTTSDVTVLDSNGRIIYSGNLRTIDVTPGLYLVYFNDKTYKLLVR